MNRCPNCNYANPPTSTFCGYCGASLAPTSSPFEPTHRVYDETPIPPPPPGYGAMPTLVSPQRWQSYKRTVGGTIHSLLWYLWAVVWFSLALGGGILYDPTNSSTSGLIVIGCLLAGLIILIPLLLYRKQFYLAWWVRLMLEIGLLGVGVLFAFVTVRVHDTSHSSTLAYDQALGFVFVLYGLAAAFVAFW